MRTLLILSLLSPLLASDAAAKPDEVPDLSCEASGNYIGNAISPVFGLKIGPPHKREWSYTSSDDMFGMLLPPRVAKYSGTYEMDGDLVVFSGKLTDGRPVVAAGDQPRGLRLGLNFGFPDGKVAFNRFFPDARGELAYYRKWFRKEGQEWRPAEERRLTLTPPPKEPAETWEVVWKGERIRWGAAGKAAREAVDLRLTYKRTQTDGYHLAKPAERKWEWLPGDLLIERVKDKVVSVRESNPYVGELRGFHPGYAELAGTQ
jgi:hypothetical protein